MTTSQQPKPIKTRHFTSILTETHEKQAFLTFQKNREKWTGSLFLLQPEASQKSTHFFFFFWALQFPIKSTLLF